MITDSEMEMECYKLYKITSIMENYDLWDYQGAHYREKSGKTGNFVKKNSLQGKIREFGKMGKIREKSGNFTKTCQGNIREFSAIYIY